MGLRGWEKRAAEEKQEVKEERKRAPEARGLLGLEGQSSGTEEGRQVVIREGGQLQELRGTAALDTAGAGVRATGAGGGGERLRQRSRLGWQQAVPTDSPLWKHRAGHQHEILESNYAACLPFRTESVAMTGDKHQRNVSFLTRYNLTFKNISRGKRKLSRTKLHPLQCSLLSMVQKC